MSVSLRMTRLGSKGNPFYRIIVIDSRSKRDGKYIEKIGSYNPKTKEILINKEIALKWLKLGAIPSKTVRDLFSKEKIMEEFHNYKTSLKSSKLKKSSPKKTLVKKSKKSNVKNTPTKKIKPSTGSKIVTKKVPGQKKAEPKKADS